MTSTKLKDIASELGIAVSTVSRALNGSGRVSPETRERVLKLAESSSYTVNVVARSLRLKSTHNIGIVVPDISNNFFSSVIKSVQTYLRKEGYTLTVCNTNESAEIEQDALQSMLEHQVAGLILASIGGSPALLEQFERASIPVVLIDNLPAYADKYDWVSIDNRAAAFNLTKSMIARGYTQIGMINGPMDQSTSAMRAAGFREALTDAHLEINEAWIRTGEFSADTGYELMTALLEMPCLPHAMIFANNLIAYGAIRALFERGYSIPGEMGVASFDAFDNTGIIRPVISSVNQPTREIGEHAAQIILSRVHEGNSEMRTHALLQPYFIEGDSL